ncbi:A disintegrin and metalloproteinase with thrombospondin motifs 20 [Symbiodinium microadriaticum]|uniref:A disintegrin and metalloproteinase with thrombospondin motifs 20 n=1 Tax=Symbiodinium microadriaticum TaxID=2951 RepID=A0A1Q9CH35_SYMMI|nr:A disintegrin and metalloproteinase with thrombospondin motifs 20 [Symbiodinium microadriaticum]
MTAMRAWSCFILCAFRTCIGHSVSKVTPPTAYVTLEMYAAVPSGSDVSKPGNIDLFDASGLAKFLATEVVAETGKDPLRTARENGIDTIVKYQIRVRNNKTSSDVDVQAEFAKFVRFEDGAVLPATDAEMFARSGDLVGIQSYHPPNGDVRYPTDSTFYWFSLSGPCPNLPSGKKTSSNCTKYEKGLVPSSKSQYVSGGLCNRIFKSNIPDGTPGCSYYVENFTAKKLDSIVGIKEQDCGGRQCADWQDFRLHCSNTNLSFTHLGVKYCKEYDFPGCLTSCQDSACHAENEVGLPFWTGRCNASRNSDRASAIKEAFGGSIVDLYYAHNPSCDKYGPMCNKPVPDAGVSYCHRDGSGVCDACYVPGTANPPSPRPAAQVPCRVDLFLNKKMPQYKDAPPVCASDCHGNCSLATDRDSCCVYVGKCNRVWQHDEWGECDSKCGNGTKHRQVWCPFQDIFGPCDESIRPANMSDCRGSSCPWNPHEFGNWSDCDDGCGNGTEVQSLICDCPDGCPMGDKECAQSAKPPQPSRPCFPVGKKTGPKFCTACPLAKGRVTCTGCPRGFALQGDCEIRDRVALVTYHAQGKDLSLTDGWLASAFIPAFRHAVSQETNISVDVINFTSSGSEGDVFGSGGVDIGIVAASQDNTDESLNWTSHQLASVNMQQLAISFQNELSKYGCTAEHQCSPPAVAFSLVKKPDMMCPPPLVWSNSCRVPGTPPSHGFPGWGVALIITGTLLLVAVVAWAICSRCKSAPPGQHARLLSAA